MPSTKAPLLACISVLLKGEKNLQKKNAGGCLATASPPRHLWTRQRRRGSLHGRNVVTAWCSPYPRAWHLPCWRAPCALLPRACASRAAARSQRTLAALRSSRCCAFACIGAGVTLRVLRHSPLPLLDAAHFARQRLSVRWLHALRLTSSSVLKLPSRVGADEKAANGAAAARTRLWCC